jgi:hypothetical protein
MQHMNGSPSCAVCGSQLGKMRTFQEVQYSQAYPNDMQIFPLLFRVVLSLNPRLAFGLKIRHLLRHKNVTCLFTKSRVQVHIQSDKKVSVHLMITIQKVTSKVQTVPLQSPDIY